MKTLKLEVGKSYRSRNGRAFKVITFTKDKEYPYNAINEAGLIYSFTKYGRWDLLRLSPIDLIISITEEAENHNLSLNNMKLEVGKSYRTRNGKVISIIKRGFSPFPYIGIDKEGFEYTFMMDGRHFYTKNAYDLIEEVKGEEVIEEPKLKLEVGKSYKTQGGFKVKVIATDVSELPKPVLAIKVDTHSIFAYTEEGTGKNPDFNIVSEWEDEPFVLDFDWSALSAWADKYVAMDKSGRWYSYGGKPIKGKIDYHLSEDNDDCQLLPKDYNPKNFTGSWEDSVFINPKYQQDEN